MTTMNVHQYSNYFRDSQYPLLSPGNTENLLPILLTGK
jgi:hypothetical protein